MQDSKLVAAAFGFGTAAVWSLQGFATALVCLAAAAACAGAVVVAERRRRRPKTSRRETAGQREHPYAKYARGRKVAERPRVQLVDAAPVDEFSASGEQVLREFELVRAETAPQPEPVPGYGW